MKARPGIYQNDLDSTQRPAAMLGASLAPILCAHRMCALALGWLCVVKTANQSNAGHCARGGGRI